VNYSLNCVVPDLKDNTEYHNYTRETEVIRWFWEILEDLDRTHKAAFLQFVTGIEIYH